MTGGWSPGKDEDDDDVLAVISGFVGISGFVVIPGLREALSAWVPSCCWRGTFFVYCGGENEYYKNKNCS